MYKNQLVMINKKIILGLFFLSLLSACASPTAMLGPTLTFTSTGSALQTGFSYGTGEIIKKYTGKSPVENLQDIAFREERHTINIQKETLESEEFHQLVNLKIQKLSNIQNLASQ